MKNTIPSPRLILVAVSAVVAIAATGCKPAQADLPAGKPTKISKLHNLNQDLTAAGGTKKSGGPGDMNASAPAGTTTTGTAPAAGTAPKTTG